MADRRRQTARRGQHATSRLMDACLADARKFRHLVHQGQGWWQHPDSGQKWRLNTVNALLQRGLLEVKQRYQVSNAPLVVRPTNSERRHYAE